MTPEQKAQQKIKWDAITKFGEREDARRAAEFAAQCKAMHEDEDYRKFREASAARRAAERGE